MDNRSQELLNSILKKHISEVSESDMVFLKARRDYLTLEQQAKYFTTPKTEPTYNELLEKAKGIGYKGPRIGKDKLIEYINSK